MPDWPAKPLLTFLFLENPWPIVIGVGVIALVIFVYGARLRRRSIILFALILALACAGVWAMARFVETDREVLLVKTQQLVASVAPNLDREGLANLLNEQVTFHVTEANQTQSSREQVLRIADRAHNRFEFQYVLVRRYDARIFEPGRGQSYLHVLTTLKAQGDSMLAMFGETPFNTSWLLDWRKGDDGVYRISRITWLKYNGQDPTANMLP